MADGPRRPLGPVGGSLPRAGGWVFCAGRSTAAFDRALTTPSRDIGEVTLNRMHQGAIDNGLPIFTYTCDLTAGRVARPAQLVRLPTTALKAFVNIVNGVTAHVAQVRGTRVDGGPGAPQRALLTHVRVRAHAD